MTEAGSLLHQISSEIANLGAAEQRVARYVTADPGGTINLSMAALAAESRVSDPTVVRFFRRFGFSGYNDFKMRLAQDLVPAAPFEYEGIQPHESVAEVVRKTCTNSINAIQRALQDFNVAEIERATEALLKADWIAILATGISEIAALDAEHKFFRLGLRCAAVVGSSRQTALARNTRPGEILLIFSQSGATRRLVEVAEAARERGATTLAVTAPGSPLAETADHLIGIKPYQRIELMTPLASRLNHQLLVNMLVTTMSIASGAQFPDQLPALDSWVTDKL
ncbi:MAG: MurR/RpiR family transcriptional regulator [Rhodospirillales bacterium]